MPDEFADVLDRLDIDFEDMQDLEGFIERLSNVLGQAVSTDQLRIAQDKFRDQSQRAATVGFRVSRFQRGGNTVIQLRDSRGRFVTDTIIGRSALGKRVVQGAGRIDEALRRAQPT